MAERECATSKQASCCPECGAEFRCDIRCGESRCWCFDLPTVAVRDESQGCVCPQCLQKRFAQPPKDAQG